MIFLQDTKERQLFIAFVTVWLGIYEISTGKLTAANAGHEYPAIRPKDGVPEATDAKEV